MPLFGPFFLDPSLPSAVPPSGGGGPSPAEQAWDLTNTRDEIDTVEEWLLKALDRHGYADSARFAVRLALEEALANAFKHGHKTLPAETPVHVELSVAPTRVKIIIEDRGPGFTPEAVPDPTVDDRLEIPAGRGLLLMRAYMAEVEYEGRGNRVRMVYER